MKKILVWWRCRWCNCAARFRCLSEEYEIIPFERNEHISLLIRLPYYIGDVIENADLLVQSVEGMSNVLTSTLGTFQKF